MNCKPNDMAMIVKPTYNLSVRDDQIVKRVECKCHVGKIVRVLELADNDRFFGPRWWLEEHLSVCPHFSRGGSVCPDDILQPLPPYRDLIDERLEEYA